MNDQNVDRPELVRRLRLLEREAELLRQLLSRAEERLFDMRESVGELLRGMKPGVADDFDPPRRRDRRRCNAVELLRLAAAAGVASIEIHEQDGGASVRVEGGRAFALPATLAALLHVLVSNPHAGDDELVGWKSHTELARLLGRRMHKTFKKHAVTNLIWRLRVLMAVGGVNPFLVQTHPKLGARFAVRRKAAMPAEKPVVAEGGDN